MFSSFDSFFFYVPFFVNVFRPYKEESRRPSFSESRRLQRACLGNGAVVVSHTSLLPRSQVLLIEKIRSSLPKPSFLNSLFGLDFFKIKKKGLCVFKIGRLNPMFFSRHPTFGSPQRKIFSSPGNNLRLGDSFTFLPSRMGGNSPIYFFWKGTLVLRERERKTLGCAVFTEIFFLFLLTQGLCA